MRLHDGAPGHPWPENSRSDDTATRAVELAFRDERMPVLALLARQVGDLQLAEDALQDAFVSAVTAWRRDGVPASPGAWITVAARRKAIDLLRRDRASADRAAQLANLLRLEQVGDSGTAQADVVRDDRLRLIFTCCHPALDPSAQVALTLRVVGGLTTAEIARAFVVAEPTMGKRIVRAKRKIADGQIPYRLPRDEDLKERIRGVLRVVYLIFNEGYAATAGLRLVRGDLCGEALRFARLLTQLVPNEAEAWGLLALLLLHDARVRARVGRDGGYVPLQEQDRGLWDLELLEEGRLALETSARLGPVGEYQLHSAITSLHLQPAEATDWAQIASLYGRLHELVPNPVVALNQAAAVSFATGPHQALRLLEPLLVDPTLQQYQPLWATHADLLRRAGDLAGAVTAYGRAIGLTANAVQRDELERRRAALTVSKSGGQQRRD